ncbi:hypothetical protein J8I87_03020 [Paraburkholderia sp. LEh10]|uniref:abortive infection system antitoxin AbiGi family protein n=1 Tax=Paraburkholderia sp. LEh10 TaxID=2821353 RepID=UPI001AE15F7E|nr:abortive infection system antitoxin AbiGi family protein [Paraburkholderia sp. LEh10]MBP0588704.1 hypothetical protein [Paraburkholderia sp. LEh10]
MAKPKSHTLFHFTSNLDILKSILSTGLQPRYAVEDLSWLTGKAKLVAYPMICFCDIPLGRIENHVDSYGSYGIGMSKEWAIRNQLNPVIYLSDQSLLRDKVENLFTYVKEHTSPSEDEAKAARWDVLRLLQYVKPLEGTMMLKGAEVHAEFYQESEWRYVLQKKEIDHLLWGPFDDPTVRNAANETTKGHELKFNPDDIRYLFVAKDADIPPLVDFINTELDDFKAGEMKILLSRIVSLESLAHDL